MYLWITSYCNMECEHCCNSADKHGKHMDRKTWLKAIDFLEDCGEEYPSVGGGEPTTHPDFYEIVARLITKFEYPWMATNGKIKERALFLGELAKKGVFGAALSQDPYHEDIDEDVVEYFESNGIEIRNNEDRLSNNGRCDFGHESSCCCPDPQILVDGRIKLCGCDEAPIVGDIWRGFTHEFEHGECCKTQIPMPMVTPEPVLELEAAG